MQVEFRIKVSASPATIFRIYEDVGAWHTWDPDTRLAVLDGPFEVGSRGRLTPTQGRTVPMEVTSLVRDSAFTVEAKIPLLRMRFDHELVPAQGMTEVTHRVVLSGPLSRVIGPMLVKRLNLGLPVTLGKLKALAESRGAT